jgi:hypothetical protein
MIEGMRATPIRPLPTACWWNIECDRAHLHWNFGCIAYVVPRAGKYQTVIQWRQHIHQAPAGSLSQGIRWIERWVEIQRGTPGGGKKRWHDAPQELLCKRLGVPSHFSASEKQGVA